MPLLTQLEIQNRAISFVKEWKDETRERAEAQTFWNEFFSIFGLSRRRVASYEEPVKKFGNKQGFIDLFWKGILVVEHKSTGESLDSAYTQALESFEGIPEQELPQYVLVSDFLKIRLYDLDSGEKHDFDLNELPYKIHLFGFISGYKKRTYHDEDPVNIQVAEKIGELHDELLKNGYKGHELEVFLVRIIYCLFADDTGIFPKDHFEYFIESRTDVSGRDTGAIITTIFEILNKPIEQRQITTDEELQQFQYIDGSLFKERLEIPTFSKKMRGILVECCTFDWGKVSPAIFGSMFQAVMDTDKEKRRNLGAHYTSEKNILKVVNGLFLDDLNQEFEKAKHDVRRLRKLNDKLRKMRFFDPACGCGNFLIITYREIRLLEIRILKRIRELSGVAYLTDFDVGYISHIDVDSMYGIELEEFPARIAEVALWLTDHQMNMQLSVEFGKSYARLPLQKSAYIKQGNALLTDWNEFFPIPQSTKENNDCSYFILGNPPFVGKKVRTKEQNEDMKVVFKGIKNYGNLDYVCSWYVKAAKYISPGAIRVAFVSTNSITQGEQVGILWKFLQSQNINIDFAHRTFKWSNEARGTAAVYCVIIGFSQSQSPNISIHSEGEKQVFEKQDKFLYDYISPDSEPGEKKVKQINPYLVDSENILITSRSKPICNVPKLNFGSMPNDNGFLLMDEDERVDLLKKEPGAKKYIKPLVSAREYFHGDKRYCLWLVDASPAEIRKLPTILKRVEAVRQYRLSSKRDATVKLADFPYLFGEIRQPETNYVLIPLHSSENRKYIPVSFFDKNCIANNSCATLPNANLYHFGIVQSAMHMVWAHQICGRIKGDYRYSVNIVYNNFPWPEKTSSSKIKRIEEVSQNILVTRTKYSDSTLADLYDPNLTPKELVEAHRELDSAVDKCYRNKAFDTDLNRLEFLFKLHRKYTEPLVIIYEKNTKSKRK